MRSLFAQETHRRGQALVKLVLILPVMLVTLMVMIEVARLFSAWLVVESSAREAASYAMTGRYDPKYCSAPWSLPCDDPNQAVRDAAQEQARLYTIQAIARSTASDIQVDASARREQPKFIDVTVCSNRSGKDGNPLFAYREEPTPSSSNIFPRCVVASHPDQIQNDAGSSGDRVEIVVLYDYPLITPLRFLADWIPLVARRDIFVE